MKTITGLLILLSVIMLLAIALPGRAKSDATYELVSSSIGAGGSAVSGRYETDTIIGQPAIGLQTAGRYEAGSGFWGGGPVTRVMVLLRQFLPMIRGNAP